MQEYFKPEMRIVAIDNDRALVTFDSAAAYDLVRSPIALRIPRNFDSIKMEVENVVDVPDGNLDSKRVYRAALKLRVTSPEQTQDFELAQLELHISALTKAKRGVVSTDFPAISAVAALIRQGTADALARAITEYVAKEGELATMQRMPARAYAPAVGVVDTPAAAPVAISRFIPTSIGNRKASNDNSEDRQKFRRQMIAAAVLTPIIVVGAMWATSGKTKPADPIHDAVAQAMIQNPTAAQAQVELTKETLKQMGLDPGAAGDTGCLAAK